MLRIISTMLGYGGLEGLSRVIFGATENFSVDFFLWASMINLDILFCILLGLDTCPRRKVCALSSLEVRALRQYLIGSS